MINLNQNSNIFALICYDFAKIFYKLRGKEYNKISSKAYYYECLARLYKNEKQYNNQEIALGTYIKNLKKLYEISKEKYAKIYYNSLIKFYQVKIKNALFTSNYTECIDICNSFFKEKFSEIASVLKGDFLEDMIVAFKAYKAEAYAKLLFERNDFDSALYSFEKALKLQGQRTEKYSYGERSKIEKYIFYTKARNAKKYGENNLALRITKNLINQYKKLEYVPYEYKVFLQIIESKISIEIGEIKSAIKKLKNIIENEEVIDQYGDLYQYTLDLHNVLIPYLVFKKPIEIQEELIFNSGETLDDIKLWNYREYNLPIQQITCNNLYIDISNNYFTHLIKKTEIILGIKFPKNGSKYYPIFEDIILRNIGNDENTKEFIKRYHKEGQKDPIVLLSNGGIIDGNKRLAAIKLSKINDAENPNIKSKRDYLVFVVRIPIEMTKKEELELKSELNYQTVFEIKEQVDTKKLYYMINMLKVGLTDQKTCEILNIKIEKVPFYRVLYNLIEEFLIENNLEEDYYIIDKYSIFKHFEELNTELSKLGMKIDKSGRDLLLLKEKLKEIVFIWLTNNIDDDLISRRRILKYKMMKKIKFILIDPERNKFIDMILKKEMIDKDQIHQLLSGLVKKIKITEEKRSCIDQAKLIHEKIKYLKSRLNRTEVSIKEKNETIKFLNRSKAELSELISKVDFN